MALVQGARKGVMEFKTVSDIPREPRVEDYRMVGGFVPAKVV